MAKDELAEESRGTSLSFYFCLLLVAPFWLAIPASWVFVLYTLTASSLWLHSWRQQVLFAVALCEVLFSLYHWYLVQRVSGPTPYGPGKLSDLQIAFTRALKAGLANLPEDGYDEESLDVDRPGSPSEAITQLEEDDPRAVDYRNTLRNWFRRAPWEEVTLHEINQWIYWSIFNTDLPKPEDMPHSHRAALEDAVEQLQKRLGKRVPPGSSNGKIRPLRLTFDQVNVSWRPFTFYALIASINWFLTQRLQRGWGVRQGSSDGLEYLLKVPPTWDPLTGPEPIILLHGLGLGLLQYFSLIIDFLSHFSNRPILILLQPHISQNIFHPRFLKPMSKSETTSRLGNLMHHLGWVNFDLDSDEVEVEEKEVLNQPRRGVTVVSHSNGSYAHAWLLKTYPQLISRSCFVDPVTFCCWEGDVCYNFIYKPCKTGIELLMRYFVGTELGVANLLQRHFDWSSNSLFFEEIPNAKDPYKTLFVIGGKDDIINSDRVRRYLTSHGVRKSMIVYPEARHGQSLISGQAGHDEILRWLRQDQITKEEKVSRK